MTKKRSISEIDRVLRFVRQMRPTVLHPGDLRVGIVWMHPVVIRAVLIAFSIDSREVRAGRRANAGGLGEPRQKLFVAFAGVTPDDAAQRGVSLQGRRVDADRFALD